MYLLEPSPLAFTASVLCLGSRSNTISSSITLTTEEFLESKYVKKWEVRYYYVGVT